MKDKLNSQQEYAASRHEGAVLIIAGAGSGKTRVLTERLGRILKTGKARGEETLTVTFTNKAAGEIKSRIQLRLKTAGQSYINLPWMGTFHSIGVKMLRSDGERIGLNPNFVIYDSNDQVELVKKIMKERNISTRNYNPKALKAAISNAKNDLLSAEEFAGQVDGFFQQTAAEVYIDYQQQLQENHALDFDDLLVYPVWLMQKDQEIAEKYSKQFKYIMVDEYQDTNKAQYKLVKLLSSQHGNICVVGDDDQSIYGWRGADVRNILEFERDFKDAEIVMLEQNYRSSAKILQAGNGVVAGIRSRKPKKLWTENSPGENIRLYTATDERDEANWTMQQINGLIRSGCDLNEIAILYRINAQSRVIEEAALSKNVPYRIVGNLRFYSRKEIKDILAYLRLIYNPEDDLSLFRVINVPSRKIGAKSIDQMINNARRTKQSPLQYLLSQHLHLPSNLKAFANIFVDIKQAADEMNVMELIEIIMHKTGYGKMLADGSEEGRQRLENVEELINVAGKYSEFAPQASLRAFLEEVALVEADSEAEEETAAVTLMTAHAAKGLEFEHVFLVGLEEGLFPLSRSINDMNELDEERRLAYVAITRAKLGLNLSYAASRTIYGSRSATSPSRFLEDIEPEIIEFLGRNQEGNFGQSEEYQSNDSEYEFDAGGFRIASGKGSPAYNNGGINFNKKNNTFGNEENNNNAENLFYASAGDTVRHFKFGRGKIISIDPDYIIVDFDSYGQKELATEYANLTKV